MTEPGKRGPRGRAVFGRHAVRAVLTRRPDAIEAADLLAGQHRADLATIAEALAKLGVPIRSMQRQALDRLAGGQNHQGIIVYIQPLKEVNLHRFEDLVTRRGRSAALLVLDGVEDPRNLGACLRTADAAGIDAVVVPRSRSAKLTAAASKAAAGAAETVPLVRVPNLARTLKWLKQAGVWVVGADSRAGANSFDVRMVTPVAVVLGGEGRGLRRLTLEACDELVKIPMLGTVQSLNVSVAAGIMLYELRRQKAATKA